MSRLAFASSVLTLGLLACSSGSGDHGSQTGAAGTGTGAAGTAAAGTTGTAGTSTTGAAGTSVTGAAGTNAAGTTGAAGTGAAGSSQAGASGSAGTGAAGTGAAGTGAAGTGAAGTSAALAKFSFFVTSYPAMKTLAGKPEGFGGDLRFGKADGLAGADELCRQIAEKGMAGAGQKKWRAFLSVTAGAPGGPINGRDRIGTGPWYDAKGRLVASDLAGLFAGARPAGDANVINDLPNENGDPNHFVGPNGLQTTAVDDHDTLTGSDTMGRLRATTAADTCNDWTSTTVAGRPWMGHSWPRAGGTNGQQWASDHQAQGCTAGVDKTLGGAGTGNCIGCSGGFGGFFCFAVP